MMERFASEDGITDQHGTPIPWPTVFDEFGSDKGNHGYAPFYTSLEPPYTVLEIGVAEGASLRAWRKLWPRCTIVGLDVLPMVRVTDPDTFVFSEHYRAYAERATSAGFDLIVDDASHVPAEQVEACQLLSIRLRPGGVYVIEDVADASIQAELGGELIRTGRGYDDCLLVIRA